MSVILRAEQLTTRAGGRWHGDHGVARCPCCERLDSLTIENGNRAVLVSCSHGCCRRAIISIFRARGLLDQGGRP